MTCNPNWQEIRDNLFFGQQVSVQTYLIAQVFSIELKSFIEDITKNNVFGIDRVYFYTIEFQKRGLPHTHWLFIFNNGTKIDTEEKLDKYIYAE